MSESTGHQAWKAGDDPRTADEIAADAVEIPLEADSVYELNDGELTRVGPTLVGFLRARLDEDEAAAKAAAQESGAEHWKATIEDVYADARGGTPSVASGPYGYLDPAIGEGHIARWDPARVLREVEAKRRMLDRLEYAVDGGDGSYLAGILLADWAMQYADHEGFKEEWRS